MEESGKKEIMQRIYIFLGVTFGIAWLGYATAWICGQTYGDANFEIVMVLGHLAPAIAMLVCRSGEETGAKFDPDVWRIAPHFKGNIGTYLFSYVYPTFLAALAGMLFFLAYPSRYDPISSEYIAALTSSGLTQEQAQSMISSMLGMGALAGPLANILLAVTELLGFQGYLLPKALPLFHKSPSIKASLSVSAVWALWHAPLYFDGYFYGTGYPGFPLLGLLLGTVFYFLLGFTLCYMTLRTGSILPSCFTRSGVTAMAAAAVYFCKGETLLIVGPGLYGAFGCLSLLIFCTLYFLRLRRLELSNRLYHQSPRSKKKPALPGKAKR